MSTFDEVLKLFESSTVKLHVNGQHFGRAAVQKAGKAIELFGGKYAGDTDKGAIFTISSSNYEQLLRDRAYRDLPPGIIDRLDN